MQQLTKEQAIAFCENKCYKGWNTRHIAEFQIAQDKLCIPFDVFHRAIEEELGRPVFLHEFGLNMDGLRKELMGEKEPPTLEEIINIIPEDKRILIQRTYNKEIKWR